jgi:predicted NBD/HSP70 family sugar kinase
MLQKADSDLVRRQNRGLVLETLRQQGPVSRSVIGKLTGLSPATISSISSQLIVEGLVYSLEAETPNQALKRGRPQTLIGLAAKAANVLAVSVSIEGVELVLADFNGDIQFTKKLQLKTMDIKADAFGPLIAKEIKAFLVASHVTLKSVVRIGIAVQGVSDRERGAIAWSPAFTARDIPVIEPLSKILNIPCTIANNANMIAEALNAESRTRYGSTTAVVYLGHGVGLGLLLDGKVYSGSTGRAAEFGHTNHMPNGPICRCGRKGCLEAFSADYGIARNIYSQTKTAFDIHLPMQDDTMLDFELRARNGELSIQNAYAAAGRALGFGIARLIALINPGRVVFAGPGTRSIDLMQPAIDAALEEGLVHDLRKDVTFEVVTGSQDLIVRGTIVESLRYLDRDVFAVGQRLEAAE